MFVGIFLPNFDKNLSSQERFNILTAATLVKDKNNEFADKKSVSFEQPAGGLKKSVPVQDPAADALAFVREQVYNSGVRIT